MIKKTIITIFSFLVMSNFALSAEYFISPQGSDWNNGESKLKPFKSFKQAFSDITAGDTLWLMDGDYSEKNKTGVLRDVGSYGEKLVYSAAIPSGKSKLEPTIIKSINPGNVRIHEVKHVRKGRGAPLYIGRSRRKDQYIHIEGIIFEGGGSLSNSSHITIKNSGFHGGLSIGDSSHYNGNSYNLIEDVWIWTRNVRIAASNYRSHFNVWRRVIIKVEGCDFRGCNDGPKGKQDPSVGFTVYDSHNVSVQNVIVIDRELGNAISYGDFATAQHTSGDASYLPDHISGEDFFLANNEWLGCISINSVDNAFNSEADFIAHNKNILNIQNFVAIHPKKGGITISNTPYNNKKNSHFTVENASVFIDDNHKKNKGYGVYFSPELGDVITMNNILVTNANIGINAPSKSDNINITSRKSMFHKYSSGCGNKCLSLDPFKTKPVSVKYPLRIEKNSKLYNSGHNKKPIGATVMQRYGISNSRYGDKNYNQLTKEALWPWPNEELILNEFCKKTTVGICDKSKTDLSGKPYTISTYIWESLGSKSPKDFK